MDSAMGSSTHFRHTVVTEVDREAVWRLWTCVKSWSAWDGGLKRARLGSDFRVGTTGVITPLSGPDASFTVTECVWGERCAYRTRLPLASLRIRRRFEAGRSTTFTHEVSFHGPFGWLWAVILGRGFRTELPRTMERLAAMAAKESTGGES